MIVDLPLSLFNDIVMHDGGPLRSMGGSHTKRVLTDSTEDTSSRRYLRASRAIISCSASVPGTSGGMGPDNMLSVPGGMTNKRDGIVGPGVSIKGWYF